MRKSCRLSGLFLGAGLLWLFRASLGLHRASDRQELLTLVSVASCRLLAFWLSLCRRRSPGRIHRLLRWRRLRASTSAKRLDRLTRLASLAPRLVIGAGAAMNAIARLQASLTSPRCGRMQASMRPPPDLIAPQNRFSSASHSLATQAALDSTAEQDTERPASCDIMHAGMRPSPGVRPVHRNWRSTARSRGRQPPPIASTATVDSDRSSGAPTATAYAAAFDRVSVPFVFVGQLGFDYFGQGRRDQVQRWSARRGADLAKTVFQVQGRRREGRGRHRAQAAARGAAAILRQACALRGDTQAVDRCHARESGHPEMTGAEGSTGVAAALDPRVRGGDRVGWAGPVIRTPGSQGVIRMAARAATAARG